MAPEMNHYAIQETAPQSLAISKERFHSIEFSFFLRGQFFSKKQSTTP
jgi:hypothetical protein